MIRNRLRSIACRAATSRPVDSLVAVALHQGFKRLGYRLLPREWIEGIDRFFVRDMMGNIDTDGDGSGPPTW